MPIPMMPLNRNMGKESPDNPCPKLYDQIPRNVTANVNRQKLASVPPMSLAERWPHTKEIENKMVVKNAANTAAKLVSRGLRVENREEVGVDVGSSPRQQKTRETNSRQFLPVIRTSARHCRRGLQHALLS